MKTYQIILLVIWVLSTLISLYHLFKNTNKDDSSSSIFVCLCPIVNTLICIGYINDKINPKTRDEMIWDEVMFNFINRRVLLPIDDYEKAIRDATYSVDEELKQKNQSK